MNVWVSIAGGVVVAALIGFLILVAVWLFDSMFYRPMMGMESYRSVVIQYALWNIFSTLLSALTLLPFLLIGATLNVLANVRAYGVTIFCLSLFAIGGGIWNNYHDQVIQQYVLFDQCYARSAIDFFLLPLLNCARIAYNALYPFVNIWVNFIAALEFVPPITLFKCATQTELLNMMAYFVSIFYAFVGDLTHFLQGDFLADEFDITSSLDAAGLWVDAMISPLNCFCKVLGDLLYLPLATFARLPSLHAALNSGFNVLVRAIQIPFQWVLGPSPHRPNFQNVTLEACGLFKSGSYAVRDTVFLIAQTGWGIGPIGGALPHPLALLLSTDWPLAVGNTLCAGAMALNVTATAVFHYDFLTASDGSGIKYLQVGLIVDELNGAAEAVGELFVLFNNNAQSTVTTALWAAIAAVGFLLEFGFGSIWFYLYGCALEPFYPAAPCEQSIENYLLTYPPNYWRRAGVTVGNYTFATYLSQWFLDAYQTTQGLGGVITDVSGSVPYGALFQYGLNVVIGLVQVLANILAFFFPILTFEGDPATTARAVDWNPVFNNLYSFAGAAGDSIRQYQQPDPLTNLTCAVSVDESQDTLICYSGNLAERVIDLLPVTLEQVIDFIVDIITLPTGTVTFCVPFVPGVNYTFSNVTYTQECIRVPDLSVALFLVDEALCDFTGAVTSIIPFLSEYECIFPVPPPPTDPSIQPIEPPDCGHVGTCSGTLLCSILQIFTVPLWVLNSFLEMATNGIVFRDFTKFVQFVLTQYAIAIANALAQLGLLLDCVICAFTGFPNASPNCDTPIYQIFLALGYLIRALPVLFTVLGLTVFKIVTTFLVGFITGNPIKAVIDLIVGILTDVMGGLGQAVINFLVGLFNAIGLGFIGSFIDAIWHGLCPVMQVVMNAIILVLNVFAFGSIKFVEFCCFGGACTPSGGIKREDEQRLYGLMEGVLHVNMSNWVTQTAKHMVWPVESPCNASVPQYEGRDWVNLSDWEQGDLMYCIARPFWLQRTDGQSELSHSDCDRLIIGHNQSQWNAIPMGERSHIMECVEQRFYVEVARAATGAQWFPSDWLTNHKRKYVFGLEMLYGGGIYWQYVRDHDTTVDVMLSPNYRTQWERMMLNVSHYDRLRTPEDIIAFRKQTHLRDYFAWNGNAAQLEAVSALSVGFWRFGRVLLDSLYNTTLALSDRQHDPVAYLSQGYHLGDEGAAARAGIHTLVLMVLDGLHNMTIWWSQPENLKKRTDALAKVQLGALGAYRASMRQLTMMSVEYVQDKRHEAACADGYCALNETQDYVNNYERAMRENNHSLVFKASQWWKTTNFTMYAVPNSRYPQPEPSPLLNYTDLQGRVFYETGAQRLRRYYNSLWEVSPEAQQRWAAVGRIYTAVKEQVYTHVLQRNLQAAVEYTQRVYDHAPPAFQAPETAPVVSVPAVAPGPARPRLIVHAEPGADAIHSAEAFAPQPHHTMSLYRQSQLTHCGVTLSMQDGLCRDYVAPTMPPSVQEVRHSIAPRGQFFPVKGWTNDEAPRDLQIPRRSVVHRLMYHSGLTHAAAMGISGFLELTCYTNITFSDNTTLCEECFVLDQLVGRMLAAAQYTETYYTTQFETSLNISIQLFEYLFDVNAYVIVGFSPELSPGGFPGPGGFFYNLGYIDDNTNKTGIGNLFNNSNITVPANATVSTTLFGTLDPIFINAWTLWTLGDILSAIGGTLWHQFYSGSSLSDTILGFFEVCILCPWLTGEDFLGTNKRFSIGTTLFIFFVGFVVVGFVFGVVTNFSPFALLSATGLMGMLLLFSFLTVYADWGWLCWYGLPMILGDDTMYFLTYTLLAKCVWFWGFLITNENYDNTHCYGCDAAENWNYLNCVHDRGFGDILANLIFTLELFSPGTLDWVRNSRNPLVSMIYRLPWVAERVNQFAGLNLQDPTVYKQYVGCNFIVTLGLTW